VILEEPYVCKSVKGIKSYDTVISEPKRITELNNNFENNFFIWNSVIKATHSSIDYYSEANCKLFKQPEVVVEKWLSGSYQHNGVLYLKTHAHSMKWEYEMHEDGHPIPHLFSDVAKIFELLEQVSERANVAIECVTVNEVRDSLLPDFIKPRSLVETFPIVHNIDGKTNFSEVFNAISKLLVIPTDWLEINLEFVKFIFDINCPISDPIIIESERYLISALVLAIHGKKIDFYAKEYSFPNCDVQLLKISEIYPAVNKNLSIKCGDLLDDFNITNTFRPLVLSDSFSSAEFSEQLFAKLIQLSALMTCKAGFVDLLAGSKYRHFINIKAFSKSSETLFLITFNNLVLSNGENAMLVHLLSDFHSEIGHCYKIYLDKYSELNGLISFSDNSENPRRSTIRLAFNGISLDHPHSPHALIRNEGLGRYSHWGNVIYFSTPDNSSPANSDLPCWVSIEIPN